MAKKCLVIDGDETLWWSQYIYEILRIKCLEIIYENIKPRTIPVVETIQFFEDIDKAAIKVLKFSKERFPTCWVKTYQEICWKIGIDPKKEIESEIYNMAAKFGNGPFPLKPEVASTLKTLRERGYYMVLLTIGDLKIQTGKIAETDTEKYFDEIEIVPESKVEKLKYLTDKFGKKNVWMIGDSLKSDMEAAIKAGCQAIHVKVFGNWQYNSSEIDSNLYTEIRDFQELLKIFS
ncbi:MAG: HAD family hydrolase [Patescibacteria group bacterium]|nr:HAD family hydrolase [Patescibacteria group bacterium]MDD5164575.1 HAD family hydrolase [Patescibacteria group bacterium]MDD5534330.1 HAD family hydrolase [Patescibacteria group bacterium]